MKGQMVCRVHGGASPQAKAAAERRLALQAIDADITSWGLGGTDVDPGETLLRLLAQARARAQVYAAEVARVVSEHGLQEALIGDRLVLNPDSGTMTKIDEYIRGLAVLENQERDRAARFSEMAIKAGLAERQVRLAERQGALIEQVLVAVFEDIGLSAEQRRAAPEAIRRALTAVA
jgi:hypothetical protein